MTTDNPKSDRLTATIDLCPFCMRWASCPAGDNIQPSKLESSDAKE